MAKDSGQERTEQATPKRLRESKEKGQVARSKELNSMILLIVAAAGFILLGDNMLQQLAMMMQQGFTLEREQVFDSNLLVTTLGEFIAKGLLLLAPLLGLLTVAAIVGPVSLGGFSFSSKSIAFKLEKLNPIKGIGRIFALKSLVELVKTLAKFVLVALLAGSFLWSQTDELMGLSNEPLQQALGHTAELITWSFLIISSAMIVIAALDVPFQLWDHARQMKMTRQEVKDENKETEGSPEVKGRMRSMQREISQRRMMDEVPKADVIITNPTHYAVALRYDQLKMSAPIVVAKGADLLAAKIRGIAQQHKVSIVSSPPLARALYATSELNQEVPANLYVAVAHILAYVYQLDTATVYGYEAPDMPTDLPVPDEFL